MWSETAEIEFSGSDTDDSRAPEVHYHSVANRRLVIIPSQSQNHPNRARQHKSFYLRVQNNIRKLIRPLETYNYNYYHCILC